MVMENALRSPSVQAFISDSFITDPATRPDRLCVRLSPVQRFNVLVSDSPMMPCDCRNWRVLLSNCAPMLRSMSKYGSRL